MKLLYILEIVIYLHISNSALSKIQNYTLLFMHRDAYIQRSQKSLNEIDIRYYNKITHYYPFYD